jgi:hypothetical protein
MNKLSIAAAVAAAGICAPLLAQGGPPPDPYGDATVARADVEKLAADRFATLDTNHDGSLSADERPFGGRGPGGAAAGSMSKNDYIASQVSRFERMDADHDGMLTKAERDAFRQQMIQRFQNGGGGAPGGQ